MNNQSDLCSLIFSFVVTLKMKSILLLLIFVDWFVRGILKITSLNMRYAGKQNNFA